MHKELMMKSNLSALAALVLCLGMAANVDAQQVTGARAGATVVQPIGRRAVATAPVGLAAPVVIPAPVARGGVWPYSYYVLTPQPSRGYVEYGPIDQFPFHGRAYGNPGDRWSWYYMGGGDARYLAKYYYPILP
jgi:hypothetical protein